MPEALFWGAIAGSSLLIGAAVAIALKAPHRIVGLILAFGAGTLISAVAYDLIGGSIERGEATDVALGLFAGALAFLGGDWYISSRGAHDRKRLAHADEREEHEGEESGVAIALGTVLDGVPEAFVMGLALLEGGGAARSLIVAVFLTNIPEAIGATTSLRRNGWAAQRIMLMWSAIAGVTALSSAAGYAFFDATTGITGTLAEAFAAGAILAMLTTTMIPEAYRAGGRWVGIATTFGFGLGVWLTA